MSCQYAVAVSLGALDHAPMYGEPMNPVVLTIAKQSSLYPDGMGPKSKEASIALPFAVALAVRTTSIWDTETYAAIAASYAAPARLTTVRKLCR